MDQITKRIPMQSSAVATGNGTAISTIGYDFVALDISGITTATITFEITEDESTWRSVTAINRSTKAEATTATADGSYIVNVAGAVKMRARISSWTSGTITVNGRAGKGSIPFGIASIILADVWDSTNHALVVTLGSALRATIDSIAAKIATDAIMNGNTELTPKFAKIVASASGATTLVSAVSSKKIRVLSYVMQCNAAVNIKFQSHTTPTDITGLLYNGINTGASAGFNPVGWFETVAGEALDINLSGAVAVGGHLTYVEV